VQPLFQWKATGIRCWVCSLSYPVGNAHASYCHLWPVCLCNIFTHYLIHSRIFEKKFYWTHNVCSDCFYNFESFLIL